MTARSGSSRRASRRALNPFSLSFLDIMSCGLGAVVLVFLLIKQADEATPQNLGAVQTDIEFERQKAVDLQARKSALEATRTRQAAELEQLNRTTQAARAAASAAERETSTIRTQIERARAEMSEAQEETANAALEIEEEGLRNYLIGLKVEGERIVILLDTSASMLATQIVDIIRLRNSPPARQRAAPKWTWAQDITQWLAARVPVRSDVRLLTFSTNTVDHSAGINWMSARDTEKLSAAVASATSTLPANGTNLEQALDAVAALRPAPDTVYLITDGLPTLHGDLSTFDLDNITSCYRSSRSTVTPKCRSEFFSRAMKKFYRRAPSVKVNVVLLPIEGDPAAALGYWVLANQNGGTFLSPREGWP